MANLTIPTYPERWHDWFTSRLHLLGHTNESFGLLIGRGGTHVSSYRQRGGHLPPSTMWQVVADALMTDVAEIRGRLAQEKRLRANEDDTQQLHAGDSATTGAA